jgi:hypothetical protein
MARIAPVMSDRRNPGRADVPTIPDLPGGAAFGPGGDSCSARRGIITHSNHQLPRTSVNARRNCTDIDRSQIAVATGSFTNG